MQKEIVMFLSTTPYSFENTHTIFKLADAALKRGQKVRLIASGDGVFDSKRTGSKVAIGA